MPAAVGDNLGMIKLLIDKGADVNAKDNKSMMALEITGDPHGDFAKLLREHGAKE